MIVVMSPGASREQVNDIVQRIRGLGLGAHLSEGEERTIIGVVGAPLPPTLQETLEPLTGVDQVVRVSTKYKLAGGDFHPHKTGITLPVRDAPAGTPPVVIGGGGGPRLPPPPPRGRRGGP